MTRKQCVSILSLPLFTTENLMMPEIETIFLNGLWQILAKYFAHSNVVYDAITLTKCD